MRRTDRELPLEDALSLIKTCNFGVLSLVTPDNKPYSVHAGYVYIESDNAIYIHCALKGEKLDCIAANPNAFFSVVGDTEILAEKFTTLYESAVARGTAGLVENSGEKERVLIELCKKYHPAFINDSEKFEIMKRYIDKFLSKTAIIRIDITQVTGKANK